jgi:hypothetical protein
MSQTPYGSPNQQKTPYGRQPVGWRLVHGRTCPSCGSTDTVRTHYKDTSYNWKSCALDGCLFPVSLLLWPLYLGFIAIWLFSKKRQACTCNSCGHAWNSYL